MKRRIVKEGKIEDPRALQILMETSYIPYTREPHGYAHERPRGVQLLRNATDAQTLRAFEIAAVLEVPVEIVVRVSTES